MRFGLVHRVMTDALAVLGVLAVVSTAALGPWVNALLLLGMGFALATPESWQSKPVFHHAATLAAVLLVVVQGARLVAGQPPIDVMVELAALLQVIRVASRRGAAHDHQIIVLSLLHFVAGTVLGGGLAYGLCFLGFLIVAPGALVLSHLRREVEGNYRQGARDRTGLPVDVPRILRSRRVVGRGFLAATCLISVPVIVFTALLFVLFPRVGFSLLSITHPHGGRLIGFSDHVDLSEVGMLRADPSVALRFVTKDVPDPPPPLLPIRLRGTAFDSYDGHAWARTLADRHAAEHVPGMTDEYVVVRSPKSTDHKVTFDVEPIDPPVVFLPPRAVALHIKPQAQTLIGDPLTLQRGPEGELRYAGGDGRGIRYEVYVAPEGEVLPSALSSQDRVRYLALPDLPARIGTLAHRWADGEPTEALKAHAILVHLRHEYRWDNNSPSNGKPQPIDDFLFVSHRGHCEFFSTAMALMLREVGIPSRNVTGFVGGSYNRFGHYYAVRQRDAHSWVEAYITDGPRSGWRTFDPTPGIGARPMRDDGGPWIYLRDLIEALSQRWESYVVGYDLPTQVRIIEALGRRYDHLRERAGLRHGAWGKLTRGPVVAAAALALILAAYAFWRRRRRKRGAGESGSKPVTTREMALAAAMYRALEAALSGHGLTRPTSLPPLRFAEELSARAHPLGEEVVELTRIYLDARFGGVVLSEDETRTFDRRVRAVRAWKPAPLPPKTRDAQPESLAS